MSGWREALTDLVQESVRDGLPPEDVAGNAVCAIVTLPPHQRIALARELLPDGWLAIERKDMAPLVDLERAEQRRKVLGDPFKGYSLVAKSSPEFRLWGAALYPRVPES